MVVERTSPTSSQVEVFDRILDKGIVIDAWVRIALMGIDLVTVQALVVVASIQTYLESSEALAQYWRTTALGGYRGTETHVV